jgi:hypothetical protein
MILLMVLQALLAILYFYTAPFPMTWPIYITLFINIGGLIKLGQVFLIRGEDFLNHIRLLRLIFTLTLILLEFFIYLSPEPVGLSALQGFINDAEVFVTGILVGVLWQDRLLSLKLTFSNRSKN